jgi:hypothetical protein
MNIPYIIRKLQNAKEEQEQMNSLLQKTIDKAQSFIGKTVSGESKPFTAEAWSVFNMHSKPNWMNEKGENFIKVHGWVVVVENKDEFAVVDDELHEVKSVKLNDEYDATIEGDYVHVGCQKIHKNKVFELYYLLNQ